MNFTPAPKRFVFVSMSFAQAHDADPVFLAIAATCSRLGLTALRADAVVESGLIAKAVNQMLDDARIVIADVSESRPNVYHEVGYALGSGKEVILIARRGTVVGWTLAHRRIELWDSLAGLDRALTSRLSPLAFALFGGTSAPRGTCVTPDFSRPVAAHEREALLADHAVRALDPIDSGRTLGELEPGFIGFTQHWILLRAFEESVRPVERTDYRSRARSDLADITVHAQPFGSAETEIVVAPSNEVSIVFAIRDDDVERLQEAQDGEVLTFTARIEHDQTFTAFALVPLHRIRRRRERDTPLGLVFDLVIDC